MLYENIKKLVQYGVETGLTPACEKNYTINLLLDVFKEDEYVEPEEEYRDIDLEEVLNALLDEAVKRNLIEDSVVYRDLFDTRLMNCLMPRPAQVQNEFWSRYEKDPQEATDYFYKLSQDSDYIRRYRVKKDMKWTVDSLDWVTKDTEKIVEKVTADTKEGDVILMHDCYGESVEAALQIVDIMEKQGYEFVTADELIIN